MGSKVTGDIIFWECFFTAAGISSDVAAIYAETFLENRILSNMLLDLNKEYLRDMGITIMGDVIAILRHAKLVHENTARDKVFIKVPVAAVTGVSSEAQSSSPANRTTLEHYTRNSATPEQPAASQTVKRKFNEMISPQEMKTKKRPFSYDDVPEQDSEEEVIKDHLSD